MQQELANLQKSKQNLTIINRNPITPKLENNAISK